MNENKIDESALKADSINGIPAKYIDKLNNEQLQAVIDGKNDADKNKREAGKIGEFLGTNTKNASIHSALIICIIMLLFCGLDLINSFCTKKNIDSEVWNLVFPVLTLALGYIFGKGEDK